MAVTDITSDQDGTTRAAYTLRLVGPADLKMPTIDIPSDDELIFDEYRYGCFDIETSAGPIHCKLTWWHIECTGSIQALSAYGLLRDEWMPGLPGNNKTRQAVLFTENGPALAIGRFSRNKYSAHFSTLTVVLTGKRISIEFKNTPEHEARCDAIRESRRLREEEQKNQETWKLAKQAHGQPDLPERWKNGVLYHVEQAEKLIEGKLVFTDFPDIGVQPSDVEAAKKAIAELRNILRWATPVIKDKVQQSNVVSLREAAFRYMKHC